jgi:DNA-binding CsgD family transcriptional regulator
MMLADVVGRQPELQAIDRFLDQVGEGPAALLLEGEAGIGKTTLWQVAAIEARRRGHRVLVARPVASEAQLSYAGLADLLAEVGNELVAGLPEPQRRGLEVALLRRVPESGAADQRAIATAVLTVLGRLAEEGPVLLAVDDFQWLDLPSRQVVEFAARRLSGAVGLVISVRTTEGAEAAEPRLPDPSRLRRLRIGPLSPGALHHLLRERTGRVFTRPVLLRIRELSGGNPFFALELARALGPGSSWDAAVRLPETLADIVGARIDGIDAGVREALLVVAALAEPSVELVEKAVGCHAVALEQAEELHVIEIGGGRIRFTHPLLAAGVYGAVSAARRRAVHRRLATLVEDLEERARHLALGALRADEETVDALDQAARLSRARGAPAAAAELLELALCLGADEPARRVQLAEFLYDAGDLARARRLLEEVIPELGAGLVRAHALFLLGSLNSSGHTYLQAAVFLERALADAADDRRMRAQISLILWIVLVDLARPAEAERYAKAAVADAEQLGDRGLLAQALAAVAANRFFVGQGLDGPVLERALALEDPDRRVGMLRPTVLAGLLRMWSGSLEAARAALFSARERCLERGEENDLLAFAYHTVLLECFRGEFESARRIAEDALERAEQQGTEGSRALAQAAVAVALTYLGRTDEARRAGEEALALFERTNFVVATLWPLGTLGFLELSIGNNDAAADRLGPLTVRAVSMGMGEPMIMPFAADAAEALVAAGRLEEASAVVDWLEQNGRRSDRAWALALGARCRSLLQAARGNLGEALETADRALAEHERLPMPFERARTLLVVGQLRRRARRREAARTFLEEALAAFEGLGTRLWAERARAELGRLGLRRGPTQELTPAERRVAELAAQGLTNREVAAALFISAKTVEANLARIYRKLEIRSRAELGRRMSERDLATRPGS